MAQNPPFSGQVNYSFANGYRVTFTGQAPQGTNNADGTCATSCDPVGATIPLPSKGPIVVDLNHPTNVAISVATLPSNVTPNVQEWNLDFERQIGTNMTFNVAYVGNKGTHLVTYYDYNRQQYNTQQCSVTSPGGCNFPALGAINTQATIGNSTYNSLQTSLNRRFTNNLQFSANYVWSHAIDDSPGAFDTYQINNQTPVNYRDLAAERATSNINVGQRVVVTGLYALPFGRGQKYGSNWNGVENAIAGGWQLNLIFQAQSGTPFDVLYNGGSPTVRPDLVGDPHANVPQGYYNFNPAAFAAVPKDSSGVVTRAGTTPRNYLTGPAYSNVDLSTFKDFKFTERYVLQFRAEFFNLLNHPNFVNPTYNFTDGNFGKTLITRLASERQIQFAAKFFF